MKNLLSILINEIAFRRLVNRSFKKSFRHKYKKYSPRKFQEYDEFEIRGRCRVVDADDIIIGKHKVRLAGIDAPEKGQKGKFHTGEWLDQGEICIKKLSGLIGGKYVNARILGHDKYGRWVGKVYFGDTDVSQWILEQGYAVSAYDFREDYVVFERNARKNNKGMYCWDVSYDPRSWKFYKRTGDKTKLRQIQNRR